MGTLKSLYNIQGMEVNGITLGNPVETDSNPVVFQYDDSRLPNGDVINVTWEEYDEEGQGIGIPSGDIIINEEEL